MGTLERARRAIGNHDWPEAIRLLRPLVEKEDIDACALFGSLIEASGDVPESELIVALEFAVVHDNPFACFVLGRHKNDVELIRKAAILGYADAQREIGVLHAHGEDVPKDLEETRHWYELAAKQGNSEAQHDLGTMFLDGEGGAIDYPRALELLEKSALQAGPSSASAARLLSAAYEEGDFGVEVSREFAKRWAARETEIARQWKRDRDD